MTTITLISSKMMEALSHSQRLSQSICQRLIKPLHTFGAYSVSKLSLKIQDVMVQPGVHLIVPNFKQEPLEYFNLVACAGNNLLQNNDIAGIQYVDVSRCDNDYATFASWLSPQLGVHTNMVDWTLSDAFETLNRKNPENPVPIVIILAH